MKPKDLNEAPEQQKLSDLYQTLKLEQPASELDQRILNLAKQQLDTRQMQNPEGATKHNTVVENTRWRRWQWPVSIAASVIFVSVIFIGQFAIFLPESTVLVPRDATETLFNSPQSSLQSEQQSKTIASAEQMAAEPAIARSNDPGEEPERLVLRAKEARQQSQQTKVARLAEEQKQSKPPEDVLAQKQKMLKAETDLSASHRTRSKIAQLQYQLSDKQRQLLTFQQQQTDGVNQDSFMHNPLARLSLKNLKQHELKTEISTLQDKLLEQMRIYLQHEPAWQADVELLNLLSFEQQQTWAKLSEAKVQP